MKKAGGIISTAAGIILAIVLILDGGLKLHDVFTPEKEAVESVMMNESVSDENGINFSVVSVDNKNIVGSNFTEVTTENNFVILTILIANESDEPYDVNSLRFVLIANDKEYQYCEDTLFAVENSMYMDTINPGLSKEYVIIYETPTTTMETEYILKIKSNGFSDKAEAYITLREE